MSKPRIEQKSPDSLVIRMDVTDHKWEQWFLLRSDAHSENLYSDLKMQKRHLDQARARNAMVFDGGDLGCLMQGRNDKRRDMAQVRPELFQAGLDNERRFRPNAYATNCLNWHAKFLAPYADLFALLCPGNHEEKFEQYNGFDFTGELAEKLNKDTGSNIHVGAYSGWVSFMFTINKTKRFSMRMFRHHGYGHGSKTRGVLVYDGLAARCPDATFIWMGDNHMQVPDWPVTRDRINDQGITFEDEMTFIRTPGYKSDYKLRSGWGAHKGHAPGSNGASWLRFYCEQGDTGVGRVSWELLRAK